MKNNMSKIIAILMAFVMILSFAACDEKSNNTVDELKDSGNVSENVENLEDFIEDSANENSQVDVGKYVTPNESDFTWEDTVDGVILTSYTGDETAVEIPSMLGGKNVIEIGNGAFQQTQILGVKIPSTVTKINDNAFLYCMTLVEVIFGENVTEIGAHAFEGCSALKNVELNSNLKVIGESAFCWASSLTEIDLPNGLEVISKDSFCLSGLEQVSIPASIKTISEGAFQSCKSLKSVNISNGTTKIELKAFDACESLERIEIPTSVETIEGHPLNRCDIVTIYAPAGSAAEEYAELYEISFIAS